MPKQQKVRYRKARLNLRRRRRELGLTLQTLSEEVGCDMSFLAQIERGESRAREDLAARLALRLDRPTDSLFAKPLGGGLRTPLYALPVRRNLLLCGGACGSPTCRDAECRVRFGQCHRVGCTQDAVIARQTAVDRRWVIGKPTLYCSRRCAHRARSDRMREARKQGLYSIQDVAKQLGRDRHSVGRIAWLIGCGSRLEGLGPTGGAWVFSDEDVERIKERLASSRRGELHDDAYRHQQWYRQRFANSPRGAGRRAQELAAKKGRKVGRPALRLTEETRRRIRDLRAQGKSQNQIAYLVGVSRGSVRYVLASEEVG